MTWRLTVSANGAIASEEYAESGEVRDAAVGALRGGATLVVVQELDAPEESTWGQVRNGDEVLAPDSTCWTVVDDLYVDGVPQPVGAVRLERRVSSDLQELTFSVAWDMPIMRRPGVLSAAAQLLHDVGLYGGPR